MNRRAPFIDGYHDFVFVGNSRLGEVWRANRLDDGRQVAIKIIDKLRFPTKQEASLKNEVFPLM